MTITIIFCPAQLYKNFSTINKYQLIRANIFLKTCNMLVFDLYIILYSWIWSPISCVYHKNQILHSNIVHFLWFLFSETMIPVNLELVNELWLPNIFIYNLKTFKVVEVLSKHAGLWITTNNDVFYSQATHITFICPMRFDAFPLDTQVRQIFSKIWYICTYFSK